MPATELTDIDVVLLDHDQLDAFVEVLGAPDNYDGLTILTDDDLTRESTKFNLISFYEDGHEVATQLHGPTTPTDTVLDLRRNATSGFSEFVNGLA